MLNRILASALIGTISLSVMPAALAQQASPIIVVPAGTVVPLTLVTPIRSKATKPGDTVRAAVAFPVTVGDRVAIPPGTYVEGIVGQPLPKVKHPPDPHPTGTGVQIHFTRLVFANGYSAPLDAAQAFLLPEPAPLPRSPSQPPATTLTVAFHSFDRLNLLDAVEPLPSPGTGPRVAMMALQAVPPTLPALPPLPHVGPSTGLIIGLSVGGPAAIIALGILFHHEAGSSDFIVHNAGWPFQMKLAAPLTIDSAQIAPAMAAKSPVQ